MGSIVSEKYERLGIRIESLHTGLRLSLHQHVLMEAPGLAILKSHGFFLLNVQFA